MSPIFIGAKRLKSDSYPRALQYCIQSLGMDEGEVFNMYREVPSVLKPRGALAILMLYLIQTLKQVQPKPTKVTYS